MRLCRIRPFLLFSLIAIVAFGGCGDSNDDLIAVQRERIMLAAEPDGAVSVSAVRADAKSGDQVVVFGAVDISESVIADGNAAFFVLREVTYDAHGDAKSHNPSDCPFCKHEFANAPQLTVVVNGEDGKPLPIPPQDLLDIAQGQFVVVQGTADINAELDLYTIELDGFHKRD